MHRTFQTLSAGGSIHGARAFFIVLALHAFNLDGRFAPFSLPAFWRGGLPTNLSRLKEISHQSVEWLDSSISSRERDPRERERERERVLETNNLRGSSLRTQTLHTHIYYNTYLWPGRSI